MRRLALTPALLGALTTILLTLPLRSLFVDNSWVAPAITGVVVVALTGLALRAATERSVVIVGVQSAVAVLYLVATHLADTTWWLLPTPTTVQLAADRFIEAQDTIQSYSAPAPTTPGVAFMLCVIVVAVALAVDLAAATAESPAIAGLPLLSLFLVSAANLDGALHGGWFALGAGSWLLMIGHRSRDDDRRWVTVHSGQDPRERHRAQQMGGSAVRVGVVALALAVVIPGVLPHMPTRYLLDGLGSGAASSGAGRSAVILATDLDLSASLRSQSDAVVLSYETDEPTPAPLRVGVATEVVEGRLSVSPDPPEERSADFAVVDLTQEAADTIEREQVTIQVRENGVRPAQLASPANPTDVDVRGIDFSVNNAGVISVSERPQPYRVTAEELLPTPEDFPDWAAQQARAESLPEVYSSLDPGSAQEIQEAAGAAVTEGSSPLETAQQIQDWLRDTRRFTYELDIPEVPDGVDAVASFLENRQGYCQQFASTMMLMARAEGIPSRLVIGFRPGTVTGGGQRVVRAADAHAWPELFFAGVGWVRFEPTPGSAGASTPGYTVPDSESPDAPSETSEASDSPTTDSTSAAPQLQDPEVGTPAGSAAESDSAWLRWAVLTALLAVAAAAVMPVSAWLVRRRRRTSAPGEAARVEREWEELISRMADLGVNPPRGSTPRQAGEWIGQRLSLGDPERERLGQVVAVLERARYAPTGEALPDVGHQVDRVVGHARRTRTTGMQIRALLWPADGVRAWQRIPERIADRMHTLIRRD